MRLRNREKTKPVSIIEEENEEDVDDPADDSDGDPEWEQAEGPDSSFSTVSGRKRKSFMPLQMQSELSKVQKIGEPSTSKESDALSTTSNESAAGSSLVSSTYSPRPRGRPPTYSLKGMYLGVYV